MGNSDIVPQKRLSAGRQLMEVGPKPRRLPINCPRGTVGGREVRIKLLPSLGRAHTEAEWIHIGPSLGAHLQHR